MFDNSAYVLRDGRYHLRSSDTRRQSFSSNQSAESREQFDDSLNMVQDGPDSFHEATTPQSEIVLFIARAVGFMVLVTAVILVILFLLFARAIIAFMISKMGISGVTAIVAVLVYTGMKYGSVGGKTLWNTISRAVS